MKRLADTVYWSYAAGAAGSIGLAALSTFGIWIGPGDGSSLLAKIALGLATLTLCYGLLFAMPVLRRTYNQQMQLTDRAAELEVAAITDPLTELWNRRYFEEAFAEYLRQFDKTGVPLAVLALDLDHFKKVNDTYGHDAGDIALQAVAKRLKSLTREHDIVARTGGEEFCIVAPFSEVSQIYPFADRVCRMIADMRIDVGQIILRPTISIGVASTVDGGPNTVKKLLKASDQQLYKAKRQGRNRVSMNLKAHPASKSLVKSS